MKNTIFLSAALVLSSQVFAQESVCYGVNCSSDKLEIQNSIIIFHKFRRDFALKKAAGTLHVEDGPDDLPACLANCRRDDDQRTAACKDTWGIDLRKGFDETDGNLDWNLHALAMCLDRAEEKLQECISPNYNNCMP